MVLLRQPVVSHLVEQIPCILCSMKFQYLVCKRLLLDPILSHMNPLHMLLSIPITLAPFYIPQLSVLRSVKLSLSLRFSRDSNFLCFPPTYSVCSAYLIHLDLINLIIQEIFIRKPFNTTVYFHVSCMLRSLWTIIRPCVKGM